jgi:hypothetical protein
MPSLHIGRLAVVVVVVVAVAVVAVEEKVRVIHDK